MGERRACRLIRLDRSVARYRSRRVELDAPLRARMRELPAQYRRYGYLRLHVWLRQEGLVINRKRTYRVYRAEGLSVRKRLRKRLPQRERLPITVPDRPNRRWSLDFVSDQLWTGRRFRALCVVDDCTKECPAILVDFSISGLRLSYPARGVGSKPRITEGDRPRQRTRADEQGHVPLGAEARRAAAIHPAG